MQSTIWSQSGANENSKIALGKKLCEFIAKHLDEEFADGSIDWKKISAMMNADEVEGGPFQAETCKCLWKGIAYGNSLDANGMCDQSGAISDEEDAYLQPYRAVRRFHMQDDVTLFGAKHDSYNSKDAKKSGTKAVSKLSRLVSGHDSSRRIKLTVVMHEDKIIAPMRPVIATSNHAMFPPAPRSDAQGAKSKIPGVTISACFGNATAGEQLRKLNAGIKKNKPKKIKGQAPPQLIPATAGGNPVAGGNP